MLPPKVYTTCSGAIKVLNCNRHLREKKVVYNIIDHFIKILEKKIKTEFNS